MKKCLSILCLLWASSVCAAEPLDVTVNASKVVNPIDVRVYSHFLEHIYNSCNGGLWGELVWNRSFEAGQSNMWQRQDGVLTQKSTHGNPRLVFGDENWTNYEFSCNAKKLGGKEGFLLMFRVKGNDYYWVNLGGWENKRDGLERGLSENKKDVRQEVAAKFAPFVEWENGKTYSLRLVVNGNHFECYRDGQKIMEAENDALASGCVGIGTWNTAAEFSNILVKDLSGNVLVDGNKTGLEPKNLPEIRYWQATGSVSLVEGDARNSNRFVRFMNTGTLSQKNYKFDKGEKYDYSLWLKGCGTVTFQGQEYSVNANGWTKISGTFEVTESTNNGTLNLTFVPAEGKILEVDQVSIMPRTWKEKYHGFRPDLLQAIREIQPELIRWPGGCYASAYRWKDGIGPQDDRGSYPIELWNDVDVNSLGIDEYMKLCELVGGTPYMVVNIGTKQWQKIAGTEGKEIDWLTEVCDWLEYCNGPATSRWGAVRAKNGHPEPYNVKYWEIDNEVHPNFDPEANYIAVLKELVPRMKAIDPTITIIACGSWTGNRDRWDSEIVKGAGDLFSFLSTHQYDNPKGYAVNPYNNRRFFESRREIIANSGHPNVKIFDSEWNAQSTDWRTGLHAGGILNCFEQVGDVLQIASPALFLRHVSARAWDNAFINFDHTGWFPAPNYVVMKLWREHYAPNRVELVSESAPLCGDNPIVNAVATKSADGKTLYVKVVNNQMEDAVMNVTFNDVNVVSATAQVVTPKLEAGENVDAKLLKRNTLTEPGAIAPQPLVVSGEGNTRSVVLPSLSAAVMKVNVQ
ncbi:MAG: alpha-L-arabinofuranosidase C-terminal domain-containing protein [Planctomycetia bacterium]|nr:alpha-L-arabinofuranosidase C-terminal domain-containing protein [Planctomycetia bacterium]